MKVLRTPEERFEDLAGFPYDPHYSEVPDTEGRVLRVHYLDEGERTGEPVLLMHGEPSTRGAEIVFQAGVPGAKGRKHPTVKGAGHFLQEDSGEELARIVVDFITRS